MAHPNLLTIAQPVEQRRPLGLLQIGPAKLLLVRLFNRAAKLRRHKLLAVANTEDRHAEFKDDIIRARTACVRDTGRTTGEDDRFRGEVFDEGFIDLIKRVNFRIDAALSHTASDQFCDL